MDEKEIHQLKKLWLLLGWKKKNRIREFLKEETEELNNMINEIDL